MKDGKYTASKDFALYNRLFKKGVNQFVIEKNIISEIDGLKLEQPLEVPPYADDLFEVSAS